MKYDFSGWATRNDLRCADGRIIRHGAFEDNDGMQVPLVWQHDHKDPENVLGHALLENRDDGVYAYGVFNDTESGRNAKDLVMHGDITALSIYANQLQQEGSNVIHGNIREVSLVLAGANPGAYIDNLVISHGDDIETVYDEAVIYSGSELHLAHADDKSNKNDPDDSDDSTENETVGDILDSMTKKQREVVDILIGLALEDAGVTDDTAQHAGTEQTLQELLDSMDSEDRAVIYSVLGMIFSSEEVAPDEAADIMDRFENLSEDSQNVGYAILAQVNANTDNEEVAHSAQEGADFMKHNVFEGDAVNNEEVLTHSEEEEIFADAARIGSLREAVIEHGIENIDVLFPEAQNVNGAPSMITRPMEWVAKVLNATSKSPFSRIKSTAANITQSEARAKGYIKGRQKVEEVFPLLKRVTTPQTIYKLQKLDRDDIIDITDFDVVAWMKAEMRTMLDEELARAILIGDGRISGAEDKINETNIRPIYTDDELYAMHTVITEKADATDDEKAMAFIDAMIKATDDYQGSGTPTLYIGQHSLTKLRLLRDKQGRRMYKTTQELADELGVKEIIPINLFDQQKRTVETKERTLGGIIVNLADYKVGATRGGEVTLFDDFDLNYNKYEYLIETRCSGALYRPKSAMVFEFVAGE